MSEKWIQNMHMKKGALTKTAKKEGGVKKEGGLKGSFLKKAASGHFGETTKKRAIMAETMRKFKG